MNEIACTVDNHLCICVCLSSMHFILCSWGQIAQNFSIIATSSPWQKGGDVTLASCLSQEKLCKRSRARSLIFPFVFTKIRGSFPLNPSCLSLGKFLLNINRLLFLAYLIITTCNKITSNRFTCFLTHALIFLFMSRRYLFRFLPYAYHAYYIMFFSFIKIQIILTVFQIHLLVPLCVTKIKFCKKIFSLSIIVRNHPSYYMIN